MAMDLPLLTEELPDEIAMVIFLKLPVKTLVRFQSASKSLLATIRSPKFIATHHSLQKRNPDPQILLKLRCSNSRVDNPYFTALSTEFVPTENIQMPFFDNCLFEPFVDGPCNGLLCLSVHDRIAIWNPLTREFKHVPPSTICRPQKTEFAYFGPVGFGFDSESGEYKVIRFITNYLIGGMNWINQVEIYYLNLNCWKEVAVTEDLAHGCATFWDLENGLYHWSATGRDGLLVLSFDLKNESFSTTALPEFGDDYFFDFIQHPDGVMAALAYPRFGEEKVIDLWVKKDRWTKELSIGPFPGIIQSLGFWKNGELFLQSSGGELLLLDVESGEMKNFGVYAFPEKMQVILYAESLVPIHGMTEHQESIIRQTGQNCRQNCSHFRRYMAEHVDSVIWDID